MKLKLRFGQSFNLVLVVLVGFVASFLSCHNAELRTAPVFDEYQSFFTSHFERDSAEGWSGELAMARRFVFTPRLGHYAAIRGQVRLKPVLTPWGEPWDHTELVRNMDQILEQNGVESRSTRVRMIAHAVVSSGWRQNVWHYNAWGVKQGTWTGPWYQMSTVEYDPDGRETYIRDEKWRAFSSWTEAVHDYQRRITKASRRPSYRKAARHISDQSARADSAFWRSLGEGNYYTTQKFSPGRFTALCFMVRRALSAS